MESEIPQEPILVPYSELSPEALRGVVESYVLREGTDYGEQLFSLEQKLSHVMRQLERREAHIVFDPESESIDIVLATAGPAGAANAGGGRPGPAKAGSEFS